MNDRSAPRADRLARAGEIALYIASRLTPDDGVTTSMLGAVLWMADATAWAELGTPLTGIEYRNAGDGPQAARMDAIENRLLGQQAAQLLLDGNAAVRLKARRDANLDHFSSDERKLIERCVETAQRAESTAPAAFLPTNAWALAPTGGCIPYDAIFVSSASADETDARRTRQLAELGELQGQPRYEKSAGERPQPESQRARKLRSHDRHRVRQVREREQGHRQQGPASRHAKNPSGT